MSDELIGRLKPITPYCPVLTQESSMSIRKNAVEFVRYFDLYHRSPAWVTATWIGVAVLLMVIYEVGLAPK